MTPTVCDFGCVSRHSCFASSTISISRSSARRSYYSPTATTTATHPAIAARGGPSCDTRVCVGARGRRAAATAATTLGTAARSTTARRAAARRAARSSTSTTLRSRWQCQDDPVGA